MKLQFARVGGLSPVKYKVPKGYEGTFHFPPPRKKGIYAFVYPYMESFLWAWSKENKKDFEMHGYRIFDFEGYLWCHHLKEGLKYATDIRNDNWIRIHTDDFHKVFQKCMIHDAKSLQSDPLLSDGKYAKIDDPYKRGRRGFMGRDHLEVFIEAKECSKIK